MSLKKLKKPARDEWLMAWTVVRKSERERWRIAALHSGMSVNEWMRDRLNRIAPEAP